MAEGMSGPAAACIVGVVLAAGAGKRYGMPKILAHEGRWLEAAVHAVDAGGCCDVLVAMGAQVVEPPPMARVVQVPHWQRGLAESVRAALMVTRGRPEVDGVVFHIVDTPDVGPDVVARVLDAVAERPRAALARAVFAGRPGHPVYIGAEHFDAVLAMLTGDVGAGPYLAAHPGLVTSVECADLASGRDHDTAE